MNQLLLTSAAHADVMLICLSRGMLWCGARVYYLLNSRVCVFVYLCPLFKLYKWNTLHLLAHILKWHLLKAHHSIGLFYTADPTNSLHQKQYINRTLCIHTHTHTLLNSRGLKCLIYFKDYTAAHPSNTQRYHGNQKTRLGLRSTIIWDRERKKEFCPISP